MAKQGYGTMNTDYIESWFQRETDGPMWALNLMKYKEVADYGDASGPDGKPISGLEADDRLFRVLATPDRSLPSAFHSFADS